MPHFYFQVRNGHRHTPDEDGLDLANQAAAVQIALESIRSMVAEDVQLGVVDLDGCIDIIDDEGNLLVTVSFAEAFRVKLPGGTKGPT